MQDSDEKQERKSMLNGRIVSSVIIVLFFIHPTITQQMFETFQ